MRQFFKINLILLVLFSTHSYCIEKCQSIFESNYPHIVGGEISLIKSTLFREIDFMVNISKVSKNNNRVRVMKELIGKRLDQISEKIKAGEINPNVAIVTNADVIPSYNSSVVANNMRRPIRVGYFPVSADPFHWAHLLIALETQAEFSLDKIVFIVQGKDERKPGMTDPSIRHPIAKKTIEMFGGLFEMSDITTQMGRNDPLNVNLLSLNGPNDGETNMFHDLRRNRHLNIDAYYMVGSDHFNWEVIKKGKVIDDTVKKLYLNPKKPNLQYEGEGTHRISAVFFVRDPSDVSDQKLIELSEKFNGSLNIFKPVDIFSAVSSTAIRNSINSKSPSEALLMIPARVYKMIKEKFLYGGRVVESQFEVSSMGPMYVLQN